MKTIQKNSSIKPAQQKLEAPVALTPDQIALVAAGADFKGGTTTRGGVRPVDKLVVAK
jgi:hypothetical protein